MKNNIKDLLKEKSNNEEIKDFSQAIISKVDTSKVVTEPVFDFMPKAKKSWFKNPIPYLSAACACLLAAVVITNIPSQSNNTINNSGSELDTTITLSEDLVTETYAYQVNSLSNIASYLAPSSLSAMSYKNLTDEEKDVLSLDLSYYSYDLGEMMGFTEIQHTLYKVENYKYEYKLIIDRQAQGSVVFFYNEKLVGTKNEGKDNYKCDTDITGIIETYGITYNVTGSKRIEGDGTVSFKMRVDLPAGADYHSVELSMKLTNEIDKITYSFIKDSYVIKKIYIENRPDVKVDFQLSFPTNPEYRTIKIEFEKEGDNLIVGKIKDSNGDYVRIIYVNGRGIASYGNYKN